MGKDEIIITTKKEFLKYLEDNLPEDAIIIEPAWGVHGQVRCATKKKPNASVDIRMFFGNDIIIESDSDIRNLNKLKFLPVSFIYGKEKEQILTEKALEFAKA